MVDVLHYLFESDNDYQTGEQAEAQSKFREGLYKELYNQDYKYGYKSSSNKNQYINNDVDFDEPVQADAPVKPFNPRQSSPTGVVKPFIRPTDPSNLDNVLDGSLN